MKRIGELGAGERGWTCADRVYLDDEGYLWVHARARVLDDGERDRARRASGETLDLADVLVERMASGELAVDGGFFRRFRHAEGPGGAPADALPAELRDPEGGAVAAALTPVIPPNE